MTSPCTFQPAALWGLFLLLTVDKLSKEGERDDMLLLEWLLFHIREEIAIWYNKTKKEKKRKRNKWIHSDYKIDFTNRSNWSILLFLLPNIPTPTLSATPSHVRLTLLCCPGECCSSCSSIGITQARRRKRTIIFNICQTHDSNPHPPTPNPTH